MNQKMREGLPHMGNNIIHLCFRQKNSAALSERGFRLRIAPRAKVPGLFCFPPSGEGRPPP